MITKLLITSSTSKNWVDDIFYSRIQKWKTVSLGLQTASGTFNFAAQFCFLQSVFKANKGTPDGVWLGGLLGLYFVCGVVATLSHGVLGPREALLSRPWKWREMIYTQDLHSGKKIKIKIIWLHCSKCAPPAPSTIATFKLANFVHQSRPGHDAFVRREWLQA